MEGGPRVGEGKGGRQQARVRARGPFTVRRIAVRRSPFTKAFGTLRYSGRVFPFSFSGDARAVAHTTEERKKEREKEEEEEEQQEGGRRKRVWTWQGCGCKYRTPFADSRTPFTGARARARVRVWVQRPYTFTVRRSPFAVKKFWRKSASKKKSKKRWRQKCDWLIFGPARYINLRF